MARQDACHNFEDQQLMADVISAAKPHGSLLGLIKTLSFALTTDTINVSLTNTECFPLIGVFGRHIIR